MMRALLARELRLAWRSGAEILNPLWFFLIVITLFPFGVGAAPQLLAQIAPGVVWVAALLAALKPCKAVITVEEHNVNGGVGSLVAEVLAEAGVGIPLKRLGIPDGEYAAAADRGWLRKHHGFDAASVAELAQKMR